MISLNGRLRVVAGTAVAVTLNACMSGEKKGSEIAPADTAFTRIGETANLEAPESARYDADLDVFFVSNIKGQPSAKDNNGYIGKINAEQTDSMTVFVRGGQNGVTLNAPKGMAIVGDTLWVTDIDVVRGFNRKTGANVATISFATWSPRFLNDVAAGPDGELYITDTSIQITQSGTRYFGKDHLFAVKNREPRLLLEGQAKLAQPNGAAWDASNNRLLLAPFGGQSITSITLTNLQPIPIAGGLGGYDGIEVLSDGRILVTSWQDSTVNVVSEGALKKVITGVDGPADIGVDTKRMVLALPRLAAGRLEYYHIPAAPAAPSARD
ncbi:MAG TPA: SMP-30/gluconolactonase/LRE family protein [Gemmatimonadaceae bacterium]|jgi:sugar lactone lactonase YvrE|nr:SMP-30/gluconolactonase/LRE family protein [Gemmatimonadaceae bacterium]